MCLSLITPAESLLFLKATYSQVLGMKMWALLCCVLSLFSCVPLFVVLWTLPARLLCPGDSPGQDAGVGGHALLQAIFPTQESNPHLLCLLHWQVGSLPLVSPGEAQLKITSTWKPSWASPVAQLYGAQCMGPLFSPHSPTYQKDCPPHPAPSDSQSQVQIHLWVEDQSSQDVGGSSWSGSATENEKS